MKKRNWMLALVLGCALWLAISGWGIQSAKADGYNATAAVEYARLHWNDDCPIKAHANNDCAHFVAQCLAAGGINVPDQWYPNHYTSSADNAITWAPSQLSWLTDQGYQLIRPFSNSDVAVGDLVYCTWGNGIEHVYICNAVDNGVPKLAAHTTNRYDYSINNLSTSQRWGLVKLGGAIQQTHLGAHTLGINYPKYKTETTELQNYLNELGYGLVVDGDYGTNTANAVKDFQSKHGLEQDGIFGPASYQALMNVLNQRKAPENAWISASTTTLESGQVVDFSWGADYATSYVLHIENDTFNQTLDVGGETVRSLILRSDTPTQVRIYITASNDYGSINSSPAVVKITVGGSQMSKGYARVLPDGDYAIVAAGASGKTSRYYLDIEGTAQPAQNETNVSLCGPNTNDLPSYEIWKITYNSADQFYTIKQKGTNMALDVYQGNTTYGTNVQVYESNNSAGQKWAISENGNNGYRLEAQCSGLSLDIQDEVFSNGTNVRTWGKNSSNAESWLFIPWKPSTTLAEGRYVLLSEMDNSLVMDATGSNIDIYKDSYAPKNNIFEVKQLTNGYYTLTHTRTGKLLTAVENGNAYKSNVELSESSSGFNQQRAITKHGKNGGYILRSRMNGYVIDVESGGTASGTNVVQYPYNGDSNQTWKFVRAEYSITYDANGGSNGPEAGIKYYKSKATLSNIKPQRAGYAFMGWSKTSTSSEAIYQAGDSYEEDADVTLYAVWKDSVTGISIYPTKAILEQGTILKLQATVQSMNSEDKGVIWSSSNTDVATVDAEGTVRAVGKGTVVITAKSAVANFSAESTITVITSVTGIELSETEVTMKQGEEVRLIAQLIPAGVSNPKVIWRSSNEAVAEVKEYETNAGNENSNKINYKSYGIVTSKAAGHATITVTAEDGGYSKKCEVTVVSTGMGAPDFILPKAMKRIEEEAFMGVGASVIQCPEGLSRIGVRAFANCPKLRQIYIPESCTYIDKSAFDGCSATLTIFGKGDSIAEMYARAYGINFEEVNP
ncbi:MAG: RICIN domain-containing protein [Clostridia bacterium]|nr:RICIN domain-containing protein [Clostridia bacterium]